MNVATREVYVKFNHMILVALNVIVLSTNGIGCALFIENDEGIQLLHYQL